jgi:RecA/RadA recombinase
MDKEILKALDVLKENNPYACFLNENTLSTVDKWIDTGSYVLNAIISGNIKGGGIPSGRVTLLYAESQCGKSLFVQKILANAQKDGLTPIIFDSENAIEKGGAKNLGLDPEKTMYVPIFNVEECRNSVHKFLKNVVEKGLQGKFIVAIDSLANLKSTMQNNRIEKDSTSTDMGTRARAIRELLVDVTEWAAKSKTAVVITNHVYDDPNEMHPSLVKKTTGGKSLIFIPSVSVQLSRKPIKEDELKTEGGKTAALQKNYVGILLRALMAKNRFIKQYLQGEIYLSFETGVNKYYGLLDLAVGLGVIEQNGPTYSFLGEKIGYAKNFSNNKEFWETKVIPILQERIDEEWKYSSRELQQIEQEEQELLSNQE